MIDEDWLSEVRRMLCSKYTSEELVELLDVAPGIVFDRFVDEFMELDLSEVL